MNILLIDNYDSFTFNLVQLLRESGVEHQLTIVKNNIDLSDLPANIDKVLISPGPGLPAESGNLTDLLKQLIPVYPMLGICLGHQALAECFGGKLIRQGKTYHGYRSQVYYQGQTDYIFEQVPDGFICGRYHSWLVDHKSLPAELEVTAFDSEGHIMAIRHRDLDIRGVQFHPESYMSAHGGLIILNWLKN
jgi:anthranilate synthase component II